MSKSTIRFPQLLAADGRIGTARIRAEIAGAAARERETGEQPLDRPLQKLTDPLASMRALGRLPVGAMNKTERAYAAYLEARRSLGEILFFRFECMKLRLADSTFYEPDFMVMRADGQLECHEVKGFMTDDANVKLKVAASQFPFVFRLVRRAKGGEWNIREV